MNDLEGIITIIGTGLVFIASIIAFYTKRNKDKDEE